MPYLPVKADAQAVARFAEDVEDPATGLYQRVVTQSQLYTFSDGAFDVLFDLAAERTVLMHGMSKQTAPNSRDNSYHRGCPGRSGFDKGHAMSHAQGGLEGGPNYFLQTPGTNRRIAPAGRLWRDIETYLAKHPGTYAFVRLIYPADITVDVPSAMEYGALFPEGFRAVVFDNV
ncbi:hypothetical protein PO587_38780 [Streptomyces gilvifuscus]|uniref:DNA/RNA non-specific endonuclease n=1 Tax=Streptomyces gilvifuscus TaxID=1550617 RepID=A0ABT5G689_9ACTN|nr:hypothetical protein [Streptomyces gilvifuscus]MDC2960388.1 hypothetical protein [Streptomyces gilvifuscus]